MKSLFTDWPIEQIKLTDNNYPKILKKIKKPPEKLYYRGTWNNHLFNKSVALVGSRRHTRYGQNVVEMIIPKLLNTKIKAKCLKQLKKHLLIKILVDI